MIHSKKYGSPLVVIWPRAKNIGQKKIPNPDPRKKNLIKNKKSNDLDHLPTPGFNRDILIPCAPCLTIVYLKLFVFYIVDFRQKDEVIYLNHI